MLKRNANSDPRGFKRGPAATEDAVGPEGPDTLLPLPGEATLSRGTATGAHNGKLGTHEDLTEQLRASGTSREARQLAYIVRYLYPRDRNDSDVAGHYPNPTLRARIPTIAAASGLSTRVAARLLSSLENAGLLELTADPLAKGRKIAWLTKEGESLAEELSDQASSPSQDPATDGLARKQTILSSETEKGNRHGRVLL